MSNFPTGYDDDSTLPPVNDNIDQIGGDAINALRDVVMAIEQTLGLNVAGSAPNLAARLGVFINPDGTPNASIIYALGLVTLPITNIQIAQAAGIEESKLLLDYKTSDLFNYIRDLAKDVNLAIGWISVSGVKLEPHLIGALYRHDLAMIDVAEDSTQFLNNVFRTLRDNTDSYTLINDMNNELLAHQWADGSPFGTIQDITTNDGSLYPSNYAHVASGIFLNTTSFAIIPQTAVSEQLAWDFIDQNSILTLGTRIQNLYANGISVNSRSSSLTTDGYGQPLVPPTPAIAYLRGFDGNASNPVDDITNGDDIIQFVPSNDIGFSFEEQFALVRVGDIVRVNYANDGYFVEVPYVISEKKYVPGATPTFFVRIAGKNFAYSPNAVARIDRTLFNNNKKGVLAVSGVSSANLPPINNPMPSLIIANPRGAQCLGVGFSPDEFNETHYFLYLALYPDGNPLDGYTILPGIDVTGNQGATPGKYTLQGIVDATNAAFRQPGFNYRFVAFAYEGEFGIMLADSYNNASFSILQGIVTSAGVYSQFLSEFNFPNNVIDIFPSAQTVTTGATITLPTGTISVASTAGFSASGTLEITTSTNGIQNVVYTAIAGNTFTGCSLGTGTVPTGSAVVETLVGVNAPDPLGFGPYGAGLASPPFMTAYGSAQSANNPTIIFPPLRRNNFYVNGTEQEKLANYVADGQAQDEFGDGYWLATVPTVPPGVNPGPSNVSVTYQVNQDLSRSGLRAGKTLVVQPIDGYNFGLVDYGRFIISNVQFTCCPPVETLITVYDAVHGIGGSPYPVLAPGSLVALYFNNDSVSFNIETATDFTPVTNLSQFKRHFEVYVDDAGDTFTHERARTLPTGANGSSVAVNGASGTVLYTNSNFATMDIYSMSPTLRGYQYGNVNKINLNVNFDNTTGEITGFLSNFDGTNNLNQGPATTGKVGNIIRFYDQSSVDYIDVIFRLTYPIIATFSNQYIDIQLFPTLSLDQDAMLLGTVQVNGTSVGQFQDLRQFGNTSEQQLTTSALNYIALPEKLLHFNGVIRGFDFLNNDGGTPPPTQYGAAGIMSFNGGVALVNGKIQYLDPQIFLIPPIQEQSAGLKPINFAICVNSVGDLVAIVLTDYDPVLGTPNAPERAVIVVNTFSSTIYPVDSVLFSDLLNHRKDLTPLYIVSSVVTGSGNSTATTLTNIRDVRRYVTDSDSMGPAVLADDVSQGNFRTMASALNWLKFNSNFQTQMEVKGDFTFTTDPGFTFPITVTGNSIDPISGFPAVLAFGSAVTMSGATTPPLVFNNVELLFGGNLTATNVVFNNCQVIIEGTSNLTNVTFHNCTINFGLGGTFTNVTIDPSTVTVGNTITVNGFVVSNTVFTCNVAQSFALGNNNSFQYCTFNSIVNPLGGPGYSTTDLVNAGNGLMYANVTTSLTNLNVTNCTFTCTVPDHFPFISLQLGGVSGSFAYNAIAQNINIISNTFTNTNNAVDDQRAVVAITSTITTPAISIHPTTPKLINVNISNNTCNFDQMILLSVVRTPLTPIIGAMLSCVNCHISRNVCGTIGFITACDFTNNDFNNVTMDGFPRDKTDQLSIENNSCKLIANLDSVGQYITFRASEVTPVKDWVRVGTGPVAIRNNACNWILGGVAFWSAFGGDGYYTDINARGLMITGNRISPGNVAFLPAYRDVNNSGITPPSMGIMLRVDTSAQTDYSLLNCLVAQNIIENAVLIDSHGTFQDYGYTNAINCDAPANIIGNTINGTVNGGAMILLGGTSTGGPTIRCSNNFLNRSVENSNNGNSLTISAYIAAKNNNAINSVTITENTFDSQFVDTGNTFYNDQGTNMPDNWAYHHNTNQVSYAAIPLYEFARSNIYGTILSGGGNTPFSLGGIAFNADVFSIYIEEFTVGPGGQSTSTDVAMYQSIYPQTWQVDLARYVPTGCQVIYCAIGFYEQDSSSAFNIDSLNYFQIGINKDMGTSFSNSSMGGSILDVFTQNNFGWTLYNYSPIATSQFLINSSGNQNQLLNQSTYLTLDTSTATAGQPFVVGHGYELHAWIIMRADDMQNAAVPANMQFSPFVVRYIYN